MLVGTLALRAVESAAPFSSINAQRNVRLDLLYHVSNNLTFALELTVQVVQFSSNVR